MSRVNYSISAAGSGRSPLRDNARHHLHKRQNRTHRAGTLQGKCGLFQVSWCGRNPSRLVSEEPDLLSVSLFVVPRAFFDVTMLAHSVDESASR